MNRRYTAVIIILSLLLVLLFLTSIVTGNVDIPVESILSPGNEQTIVLFIRLPRVLMALILGGALALSGFLLQTFFNNPIAGPFVLGISSGARLMIVIALIISLKYFTALSSLTLMLVSFGGSLVSILLILMISRKVGDNASLLISGIMIGYISSAVTDFLMTFASDQAIVHMKGWSLGSISGSSYRDVVVSSVAVGLSFIAVFLLSKPIGAMRLGEAYARSLGVNVRSLRVMMILLSGLLSAVVTAFAGPVSFLGIAVPFLTKKALKSSDPVKIIPASFLAGSVFLMFCDLIARCAFAPAELNISTVTGIFGAPVVIFILFNRRRER